MRLHVRVCAMILVIVMLFGALASCGAPKKDDGDGEGYRKRILLVSDFHYVKDWYGVDMDERMTRMINHINEEHEKDPLEMIIFMGDYSLGHWKYDTKEPYVTLINSGVSHTRLFMEKYKDMLPDVPMFWLAGNHEQYGEDTWREITGNSRQGYKVIGDYLLVMWDSYGKNLDPTTHSDGSYTSIDTKWVGELMDMYSDKKVILISHYFHKNTELNKSADLIADERVVALFAGHLHHADIQDLGEDFGNKQLVFAGNYSYGDSDTDPGRTPWGFRDLVLEEDKVTSTYIIPENKITINNSTVKKGPSEKYVFEYYVTE